MRSIEEIKAEIAAEADATGYMLNPDQEILDGIIEGIAINEDRLAYWGCPCRIASGNRMADFDIVCPCEYRDPDLEDYGRCYCALYVNQKYIDSGMPTDPIPERRPESRRSKDAGADEMREDQQIPGEPEGEQSQKMEIWRCQVCGYLCARPKPPPICPICRAKKDRFEEFSLS